jgi:hypothetical protein
MAETFPRAGGQADGVVPSAETWDRLVSLVERLAKVSFAPPLLVYEGPGGVTIGMASTERGFWARLDSETDVSDNKWSYSWTMMKEVESGWEETDPAVTGDANALNSYEWANGVSGVQGNGIDHSTDYPSTYSMKPASTGTPVVWMRQGVDENGTITYRFSFPNAEQGPCPEPP